MKESSIGVASLVAIPDSDEESGSCEVEEANGAGCTHGVLGLGAPELGWSAGCQVLVLEGNDQVGVRCGMSGSVVGPHPTKRGLVNVLLNEVGDSEASTFFPDGLVHAEEEGIGIWGPASICGLWRSDFGHFYICPHEALDGTCVYTEKPPEGGHVSGTLKRQGAGEEQAEVWWMARIECCIPECDQVEALGSIRVRSIGKAMLELQILVLGEEYWSGARSCYLCVPEQSPIQLLTGSINYEKLTGIHVPVSGKLELAATNLMRHISIEQINAGCHELEITVKVDPPSDRIWCILADAGARPAEPISIFRGHNCVGKPVPQGRHSQSVISNNCAKLFFAGLLPSSDLEMHCVCDNESQVMYLSLAFSEHTLSKVHIVKSLRTTEKTCFWDAGHGQWISHTLAMQANIMSKMQTPTKEANTTVGRRRAKRKGDATKDAPAAPRKVDARHFLRDTETRLRFAHVFAHPSFSALSFEELHFREYLYGQQLGDSTCGQQFGDWTVDLNSMSQTRTHNNACPLACRSPMLHTDSPLAETNLLHACNQYAALTNLRPANLETIPLPVTDELTIAIKTLEFVKNSMPEIGKLHCRTAEMDEALAAFNNAQKELAEKARESTPSSRDVCADLIFTRNSARLAVHSALVVAADSGSNLRDFVNKAETLVDFEQLSVQDSHVPKSITLAEATTCLEKSKLLLTSAQKWESVAAKHIVSSTESARQSAIDALKFATGVLEGGRDARDACDTTRLAAFSKAVVDEACFWQERIRRMESLRASMQKARDSACQLLRQSLNAACQQLVLVAEYARLRDLHAAMLSNPPQLQDLYAAEDAMYEARDAQTEAMNTKQRLDRRLSVEQRRCSTNLDDLTSELCAAQEGMSCARRQVQAKELAYRRMVLELQQLKCAPEGFPELVLPLPDEEAEVFDVLARGRQYSDYEDLRPMLHAKGRCRVFVGKHSGQDCVLKEVRSLSSSGALRRELLARRKLPHPLIVPVVAAFEQEDRDIPGHFTAYLHLPKYEANLQEWLESQECTARKALQTILDIMIVITHVHGQGVVHGDIKPSNFLINSQGQPCLSDFEMSRLHSVHMQHDANSASSANTLVAGTPEFLAPEFPVLSSAADIYALGVLLTSLLEGCKERWPDAYCQQFTRLAKVFDGMKQDAASDRPTAAQVLLDVYTIVRTGLSVDFNPPPYWQLDDDDVKTSRVEVLPDDAVSPWPGGVTTHAHLSTALTQTSHAQCFRHLVGNCQPQVVKVERLETSGLWRRYCLAKEQISKSFLPTPVNPPVRQEHPLIDASCNEYWLWHGTSWQNLSTIMTDGLDEHLSRLGGLYGAGIYFSDEACKALQYSDSGADGLHCLLYCRVILGRPYYTRNTLQYLRSLKALSQYATDGTLTVAPDPLGHHSVIANPGPVIGHPNPTIGQVHREFVVFDGAAVYPELCVSVLMG